MSCSDSNPYGTPTSLSLINPRDQFLRGRGAVSMIPDSPTSRGPRIDIGMSRTAIDVAREDTKSESPELDAPINGLPPKDPASARGKIASDNMPEVPPAITPTTKQTNSRPNLAALSRKPSVAVSSPKANSVEHSVGDVSVFDNEDERQRLRHNSSTSHTPFKRKQPTVDDTFAAQAINDLNGDIYDPIESDSESFREKQRMHSAKRVRVTPNTQGRFVSPRAPLSLDNIRKDDGFVVPAMRILRDRGAGSLLGEAMVNGDEGKNVHVSDAVIENEPVSYQEKPIRHDSQLGTASTIATPISHHCSQATVDKVQSYKHAKKDRHSVGQANAPDPRVSLDADKGGGSRTSPNVPSTRGETRPALGAIAEPETVNQARTTEEASAAKMHPVHETEEGEKIAKQQSTAERLEHNRQKREKDLAEQAEKAMLAADGAKLLEAEKSELNTKRASAGSDAAASKETNKIEKNHIETESTETFPFSSKINRAAVKEETSKGPTHGITHPVEKNNNISRSNGAPHTSQIVTKYKPRTEPQKIRRATFAAQRKADEEKAAAKKHSRAGTSPKEQDTPMLERAVLQYRALSEGRNHQSSTSSETSIIEGQSRKTITPILPNTSLSKRPSTQGGLLSSPLAAKFSNGVETPLRSALKQGSKALRRSVSFINEPKNALPISRIIDLTISQEARINDTGNRPLRSSIDEYTVLASRTPTKTGASNPEVALNEFDRKITETGSAKKGQVQTKLKVTRNVKKGKERDIDLPITTEAPSQKDLGTSSSSDGESISSFLSDEAVGLNGSSKAGPSSRHTQRRMKSSRGEPAVKKENLPDSLIDPEVCKISTEEKSSITTSGSHAKSTSFSIPGQSSISRSPAQALSGTMTPESSPASTSEEGSALGPEDESDISSESSDSSSSIDKADALIDNKSCNNIKGVSKAIKVEIVSSSAPSNAQISRVISNMGQSGNAPSSVHVAASVGKAANDQLHSELDQSLPTPSSSATTPGDSSVQARSVSKVEQKLNEQGRLTNGTRPANYRYPSLSQLRRQSKAESIFEAPSTSQVSGAKSLRVKKSPSLSSDDESSEEESSSSDDNENMNGSNLKPKSPSGHMSGLRSLVKRECFPWL